MAYCLRSLVQILEQVMHPDQHYKNWVLDQAKIPQIQSLLENATFLRDFFDTSSPLLQYSIESLEDQIMEAAGKAEDTLELHITEQILSNQEDQSFMISPPDLGEMLRAFEVAKEEVIKVKASDRRWCDMSPPVSSTRYPGSENLVVGLTKDLNHLRSRLTAQASELNIIPIVGMGGSGKTTLARILYDEHVSGKSSYFDCCAWVTVSQTYDRKQILQELVDLVAKHLNGMPPEENADLIVTLHKTLYRRRYLIVLDDIWSCQAWEDFQQAFPQENKGSRIILTTRESTLANHVNSNSHQMYVLSEDDSWKLLSGKAFSEQSCPRELEEVGKRIVRNCRGLPLALQVIGGLLSQSEKSKDFWEHVAYNISSLIAKTDDRFSGIFSWSFVNLPHYLKPCFLYMGAFPEDHVIRASTITRLWIAEGFLYPVPNKSLEESVEIHLNSLVDRNLIFIRKRKSNGKAQSYGIHDLLRDICLRKAQEKKFIYFKDLQTDILEEDTLCLRRVIVQLSDNEKKDEFGSLKLTSLARSFLLISRQESNRFVSHMCFKSPLLRVLDVSPSTISEFHIGFLLVNLRFLSLFNPKCAVPRSISVLRNLQTLVVYSLESLMILENLPQLRHLQFIYLEQRSYERTFSVHENLRSLSLIPLETLTQLLGKLPKLRKLGIDGRQSNENIDLTCFQELQTLTYRYGYKPVGVIFPNKTMFAHSIKKLTFSNYKVTQTLVEAIYALPNLQILKFNNTEFAHFTWEPPEGGFSKLWYLKFENSHPLTLLTTEIQFPVLGHLVFDNCRYITEIPNGIGGIETLQMIEVDECRTCVFESAKRIFDEQRSHLGNPLLQLRLGRATDKEREGEKEEIEAIVKNNELTLRRRDFRSTTILPRSIKSLRLYDCALRQASLCAIGDLPQLEFLKFDICDFGYSTWEPSEGGFCKLQCLKIKGKGLKNWVLTGNQFPVLQRLVLKRCTRLDDIPNNIGRIETLESLEVDECYPVIFDSAKRILEEQCQRGNNLLQLRLRSVAQVPRENDDEEKKNEDELSSKTNTWSWQSY